MKFFSVSVLLTVTALSLIPEGAGAQSIPYRTSFEEPTFTVGNLDGQDDWKNLSDPENAAFVQADTPEVVFRGSQSLVIEPASVIGRDLSAPSEQVVYVDGFYRGPTVEAAPDPMQITEPGSALILFHKTDGIMALDGDGLGDGDWTAAGVPVSDDSLQRITIRQDYSTSTWDLYIDGELRLSGLGFKNNTVATLSGINIETSDTGRGFLDDFSVTTAPPAFFGGPALFSLQAEWTRNQSNLNWDVTPLEQDGKVDPNDLIEVLRRMK